MYDLIVIAGPTASGKSNLAIDIAKKLNGEIISADSMQIYKKLDIGTAKTTPEEMQGIKHYNIDVIEPTENYTVDDFVKNATNAINEIEAKGKIPIVVGGTGLYIKALLYGYSLGSANKNESIRQKYYDMLSKYGNQYVYDILNQYDKNVAKTMHPNATKRVVRALEIIETGGTINNNQTQSKYNYLMVVINPNREELYKKINDRVDNMISNGLLKETEDILKYVSRDCQSMAAIGYKELFPYFDKEKSLNECVDKLKQLTRNYAKRQITYFKSFNDAIFVSTKQEGYKRILQEYDK